MYQRTANVGKLSRNPKAIRKMKFKHRGADRPERSHEAWHWHLLTAGAVWPPSLIPPMTTAFPATSVTVRPASRAQSVPRDSAATPPCVPPPHRPA